MGEALLLKHATSGGSLNSKIAQNLFIQSLCNSPNVGFFFNFLSTLWEQQ